MPIAFIVALLFFLSGACGLVYEVLWSRQLALVLGHTVHSLAAVLSAFMAGLALGSFLAGRYLARGARLLAVYGILEILIGLWCALLPYLFAAAVPLYRALYGETGGPALSAARFAACFLLLLIPTTCMGATLPVLSQFLHRSAGDLARTAGGLYAVNTFGAVLGAASAGFFLLPWLGLSRANLCAVGLNIALGVLALVAGRKADARPAGEPAPEPPPAPPPSAPEPEPPREAGAEPDEATVRLAAWCFGIAGFAGMATQIGWTRALTLSLGSSTYAFSLIVSIYVFGLALGGAWGARRAAKLADPVGQLARVLLLVGLQAMTLVPVLGFAPVVFFWLMAVGSQWGFEALLLAQALGVLLLLLLPTFLMGATLPLTLQIARARSRGAGAAGRAVGGLYALNTLGAILGSLAGGLVLVPLLQLEGTLKLAALLYALPGAVLFLKAREYPVRRQQFLAGVLLGATLLLIFAPRWDPRRMSAGAYLMRQPEQLKAAREGRFLDAVPGLLGEDLKFYREGASATVAVYETPDGLTLAIGGKPDASSHGDMSTQVGLTLIPMLLHEASPEEILVVGMGSGVSAGVARAMPGVKRVDLVELAPEVLEAAECFAANSGLEWRAGRFDTPGVEAIVNDGRSHLQLSSRRYDVIASEPSNPWIAGIGNLFTREAFELNRACLKPGGVFGQWLHRYGMGGREFRSVVRTFLEVFPHAQLWCVLPGQDYLLVGGEAPLRLEAERARRRLHAPALLPFARPVGFDRLEELAACFVADRAALEAFAADAPLHTDDNLLLEFAAPRTLYAGSFQFPIADRRVAPDRVLDLSALEPERRYALLGALDASATGHAFLDYMQEGIGDREELLHVAFALAPRQYWAARQVQAEKNRVGPTPQPPLSLVARKDPERGIRALEAQRQREGRLEPHRVRLLAAAHAWLAEERIEARRFDEAEAELKRAAEVEDGIFELALARARLLSARGDLDGALAQVRAAGDSGASLPEAGAALIRILFDHERWAAAREELAHVLNRPGAARDPSLAIFWALKAEYAERQNDRHEAGQCLLLADRLGPHELDVQRVRLGVLKRLGGIPLLTEAGKTLERMIVLAPLELDLYVDASNLERELGAMEAEVGMADEALEHRRRARRFAHSTLRINPRSVRPFLALARVWRDLGEEDAAKQACAEALNAGMAKSEAPEDLKSLFDAIPEPPPPPRE
ncbi:MAG: fused MFS/spermidine synthase [Planctomycetota bacterium]|nr:fused MFS/spermidine synthase [Planctomycetota bacterium]